MPTNHPRISVVRDPELNDALRLASEQLTATTEAARLRELALLGAQSLGASDAALERARATLDELGATRERGDLLAISRRLRSRRSEAEESVSDSLDWARGSR